MIQRWLGKPKRCRYQAMGIMPTRPPMPIATKPQGEEENVQWAVNGSSPVSQAGGMATVILRVNTMAAPIHVVQLRLSSRLRRPKRIGVMGGGSVG